MSKHTHPKDRAQRRQLQREHMNGHPHKESKRYIAEALKEKEFDYELKSHLGKILPYGNVEEHP